MALSYTVADARVSMPIALASVDSDGNIEQKGQVTFSQIDLDSYADTSLTIFTAGDLGLAVIYGALVFEIEGGAAGGLGLHTFTAVPNAAGTQIEVVATTADVGTEAADAVDCGDIGVIAWGEIIGTTDNV